MVFHPLLADVAGASINADAAAAPLRQMLPGVGCRTDRVQRIDLASSEIEFDDASGAPTRLHYDHVVIACGAESNLAIIPGMTEHVLPSRLCAMPLLFASTSSIRWNMPRPRVTSIDGNGIS